LKISLHPGSHKGRRDLRDDGIAETSNSVQVLGKPISHEQNSGWGTPLVFVVLTTASSSLFDARLPRVFMYRHADCGFRGPRRYDRTVGHPINPSSDVRRADARSRQIGTPDGIPFSLQVSTYSGEPLVAKAARNLFAKDDWRMAVGDETSNNGPKVPLVAHSASESGCAERLARA